MLYHLDENDEAFSWWERGFQALGLIGNPENKRRMKVVQHALFEHALKQLQIPNAGKVVPLELSRALDGTNSLMYEQRVEYGVLKCYVLNCYMICHAQLQSIRIGTAKLLRKTNF